MNIDSILPIVEKNLIGVKYADNEKEEFERLFENWTDIEYLNGFFKEHEEDLKSGFYGNITINEAIEKTLEDAERLEQKLKNVASTISRDTLQSFFKALDNNDYGLAEHQSSKVHGSAYKSWLRVYAIRIAEDCYIVTGGAIKLVDRMNEREHLRLELRKLDLVKEYLQEEGLYDKDDLESFEMI